MKIVSNPNQCGNTEYATIRDMINSDTQQAMANLLAQIPSIQWAYLYGSVAKGTSTPESDIDIAIYLNL